MTNDSLDKYINAHRDALDNDVPPLDSWDNIQEELEAPVAKKRSGWYFLKAAAAVVLLIGCGYVGISELMSEPENEYVAGLERDPNDFRYGQYHTIEAVDPTESQLLPPTPPPVREEVLQERVQEQLAPDDGQYKLAGENLYNFSDNGVSNGSVNSPVTVDANGGTAPYTYEWKNTATNPTTEVTGVAPGRYTVDVYDGNADNQGIVPSSGTTNYSWAPDKKELQLGLVLQGKNVIAQAWSTPNYQSQETDPDKNWDFGDGQTEREAYEQRSGERYEPIYENPFKYVMGEPLSTFSIDVDKAGYSNMRRYLNAGALPPRNAVKIEEMVNYFDYQYENPTGDHPFAIHTESHVCPWNNNNQLLKVGLKGKDLEATTMEPSNLVFLIDVSGSMMDDNKLPLLKAGFKLLVDQLREQDRVSIVVYAGSSGLVLEPTAGSNKDRIMQALDRLEAGGSTAGGAGIELAYNVALEQFKKDGNNRVILATDGDFNIGASSDEAMVALIEEKRKSGVFLSVLGFGTGNLQDSKMEKLADNGNGNYSYIDNMMEAKKVFVTELGGTLYTIAKDVKLQLEFNPAQVSHYRLIGYENRVMAAEDFANDLKDAGELGAGHTVTALYEIVPTNTQAVTQNTTNLRYQKVDEALASEVVTVKFRYKKPDGDKSILLSHTMKKTINPFMSRDFAFAASVAQFGMILRGSQYRANSQFNDALRLAYFGKGEDRHGYRAEYILLVEKAMGLMMPPM
jgi:secreted protein with Ig-like and vWFA domain